MHNSVFLHEQLNFKSEPLFFGTGANVQEYADPKFPKLEKNNRQMISYFWVPEEVSLLKDRNDFNTLSMGEQFIFVSNLKYQILLDSIQGRGPLLAFLPFITLPELEGAVITWGFFETIHSRSYTHIIRNLFTNPSEVTDHIIDIPQIIERAKEIGKYYDDFIEIGNRFRVDPTSVDMFELRKKLYLALMCINILEGMRFYVSFSCTFAFGERGLMEGTTKIMGLIARDEAQHLALTQNLLKMMRDGEDGDEWIKVIEACEDEAVQMFRDAAEQEKEWAKYLFENGQMIGLNANVLSDYVDHLTYKRMRGVGQPPIVRSQRNPLGWMEKWLNSRGIQEAPQETEKESYMIGAVDSDISDDDFDDMSL